MKFKSPIEVQAGISDGDPTNPLGQSGYLLSSDGSNVNWISPGGLSAETAEAIVQPIKASGALSKGDPVYIVGYQNGQNVNIVAKADSSDAAKMPVVGLADDDYANNNFGTMTAFGSFNGDFDTTGGTENWAVGDIIFVKPGGGLTNVKPIGTDLIQNIAIVSRVQQNTGELEVIALGRTNDVPNLPTGRLFVGTAANTSLASDVIYVDDTNDRVGIGTASPGAKLHIEGDGSILRLQNNNSDANGTFIDFRDSSGVRTGYLGTINSTDAMNFLASNSVPMIFSTNSTERMRIDSSGNVGIGTTSPSQKLHVVGNTKIEGVVIVDSGNSSLYIGSSTTGQSSTSTGDRNVVIGPSAFRSNTSAKYNTAVGHAAMQDTTTGNYNSVLGNQALRDNIDGDFNVAVGNQTMAFTTNSSNNTAVGYRALYQAQSGSNTAIGQGAFNSLQSSTSSGGNTGIGQEVLNKITSGQRNVGVGHAAGQKYGGGNNNVVTANDSVFIGADSDAGGDNQTNQIVIGYNAIGLGSNTAVLGNNSIVTTQLKGNVGIGTTSPSEKLDVNGNISVSGNINLTDGAIIGVNGGETFTIDKITGGGTANLTLGTNTTVTGGFTINNAAGLQFGSGANKLLANAGSTFQFSKTGGGVANYEFTSNVASVTFLNTGNVGIGTNSPSQKLHVSGNARVTGAYYDSNNSPGTANQVLVSTVTGTDWVDGSAIPGVPDGSGTAGKIVMWQDSDTLTDSKITQTAGDETNYVDIDFANVEDLTITGDTGFSTFTVTNFDAVNFSGIENNFNVGSSALRIAIGDSSMSLGTTTADSDTLTVGYETTRFIGTGNVGIGTTSPVAKLEVEGGDHLLQLSTTSSSGNPYVSFNQAGARRSFIQHSDSGDYLKLASEYGGISFFTGTGGTETQKMTILSGGNVGIGTTSPGAKLTVVDDILLTGSSPSLTLTDATSSFVIKTNTAGEGIVQTSGTSKPIRFFRNNGSNESMRIDGAGNVGIGTTSPQSKLQVNGGVQLANDTASPSASKVGTFRYRTSGNNSYVDMCMQTGASTYAWVNIVQNTW